MKYTVRVVSDEFEIEADSIEQATLEATEEAVDRLELEIEES